MSGPAGAQALFSQVCQGLNFAFFYTQVEFDGMILVNSKALPRRFRQNLAISFAVSTETGLAFGVNDCSMEAFGMQDSAEQLELYRLLVENSLGLMCIHDLDGVLSFINPAAAHSLESLKTGS